MIEGIQATTALKRMASDSAFQAVGIVRMATDNGDSGKKVSTFVCACVRVRARFANCGLWWCW